MNLLGNFLLTSTAVAPVVLVYAIISLFENDLLLAFVLVGICAILVTLCLVLLKHISSHVPTSSLSITGIDSADKESLGIMVLYLVPFMRLSPSDFSWTLLIPVVALFVALVATGTSYHFNPLLNFFGWHFYKIDTKEGLKYLFITKKRPCNVRRPITVGELTKHTLIDVE